MSASDSSVSAFGLPAPVVLVALAFLALFVVRQLLCAASFVWRYFLRPAKRLTKFGSWAVVTGATDGIGRVYAFQLAKQGLNVLLISRSVDKLNGVAKEISAKYPAVKVDTLPIDFSDFDEIAQEKVARAVKGLEVGVLINNVGLSYDYPEFFNELTRKNVKDLLAVNIDSVVYLTHVILPQMLARGRGAIVNISSVASFFAPPLLTGYAAAKSFVDTFSKGLHHEYASKGISVQVQNPFFVATKMAKMRPSFLVPSPEGYVRAGMRFIGHDDEQVLPYWPHALEAFLLKLLPHNRLMKMTKANNMKVKARALKKKAEAAKKD